MRECTRGHVGQEQQKAIADRKYIGWCIEDVDYQPQLTRTLLGSTSLLKMNENKYSITQFHSRGFQLFFFLVGERGMDYRYFSRNCRECQACGFYGCDCGESVQNAHLRVARDLGSL